MPRCRVTVDMFPGRTQEMKTEMVKQITDIMVNTLNCDRDWVHVNYTEVPLNTIAIGGVWADEYFKK